MTPITHAISGCFDGFHEGHHHILRYAKFYDQQNIYKLVVFLNDDEYIRKHKGELLDPLETRIANVKKYADEVVVFSTETPYELFRDLKPNLIFCGNDWVPEAHCAYGIAPIVMVPRYKNFSSSHLRRVKSDFDK